MTCGHQCECAECASLGQLGQLDEWPVVPPVDLALMCQFADPASLTPEMLALCQSLTTAPPGAPPLPTLPAGVVTEDECKARQQQAYEDGKAAERSNVLLTAAISAGVTALVAGIVGYAIGR